MADNNYKIQLGVSLDTSGLREDINKIDDKYKVKLGVDLKVNDIRDRIIQYNKNTNNAKLKLGVKLDTDDLKKQINQLNLGTNSGDKGVAIPVNTESLESSFREVKNIISDIKNSIGTLDSSGDMKSLLSSINQISTALDKASNQFSELNAELKALSSKDFSINVGINTGGSNPVARNAAYGNKVRNETLPQLKQQAEALENYLKQYYKVADGFNAAQKLLQGTNAGNGKANLYDLLPKMLDSTGSLSSQMTAWKEYIGLMKEAANIKGIDISGVLSQFSRQSDELVKDAQDVQTGAKEMQDAFKGLFGGSNIDADGLTTQLNSIVADLSEIKTVIQGLSSGISLDGLTASFNRLSESIELLVKNCTTAKQAINDSIGSGLGGSTGGTDSGVKNLNNDLKQATVTAENTADAIDGMRDAMSGMKFNTASIDAVTKDLEEMNIVIEKVTAREKNGVLQVTVKGINEAKEAVTVIKQLDDVAGFNTISTQISKPFKEGAEAARQLKKEIDAVGKIKDNFNVGTYDNQLSQIENSFNQLSIANKELQDSFDATKNAYRELELAMGDTGDEVVDRERLVQAEERYAEALKKTTNLIRIQAREENAEAAANKLAQDKESLKSGTLNWMKQNTRAARDYGDELKKLIGLIDKVDDAGLKEVKRNILNVQKSAQVMGKTGLTTFDKLKSKVKEYASYISAAELFMYAEQALSSMFEQVKLIDSAMTELKKVTNETDTTYKEFLTNAATRSREIGTTIDGLVKSTADFARLGYDFADAQGLAEVANIYAVVGDEIDSVETATESLISTMAAFKDQANGMSNSDFAMSIVDKFNEIGNNFAISSGGIGEALERSASSLDAANNTIDESIALITAANTVVQDPEQVGRLMPTIKVAISVKGWRQLRPSKDFLYNY